MAFYYGDKLKISVFGQSHSEAVGVVCEGIPAGTEIDEDVLYEFMKRRAPGRRLTTPRSEADKPVFLSGLTDGKTNGAPLCAVIYNTNTRSQDYSELKIKPRPGHSDYPAYVKFGGNNDIAGGGQFSARLTAPLCIVGGIALGILKKQGIEIAAHIASVGSVKDDCFDPVSPDIKSFERLRSMDIPVLNESAGEKMASCIEDARLNGDSVGGVIECIVTGLPVGVGNGGCGGLDGAVASAVFGIPAVKGIEFGAGFAASEMLGSENNDPFYFDGSEVKTKTNNCGGVLGGMSNGMPLVFRAAFKPTPSISKRQETVDLAAGENTTLTIKGRHDPCVAIRAVPVVEAAAALAVYNMILSDFK